MRCKLTAKEVDKLKAPTPNGKQQLVWDTELTGFGVLVSGATNSKSYVVQRDVRGKARRVTLAATNVIDLKEAKRRAQVELSKMYAGIDPRSVGRSSLKAVLDSYLTDNKSLRPRTADNYRKLAERYLKDWENRPLKDITPEDVSERHAKIAAEVKSERYSGSRPRPT